MTHIYVKNKEHQFQVGQQVTHVEHPDILGVIVDVGYLGQMEHMERDFDLTVEYSDDPEFDTFADNEDEYYQPWYRIMWDEDELRHFITQSGKEYNGQESEGQLILI